MEKKLVFEFDDFGLMGWDHNRRRSYRLLGHISGRYDLVVADETSHVVLCAVNLPHWANWIEYSQSILQDLITEFATAKMAIDREVDEVRTKS